MRILVTVASRHGATQEIGDEVARALADAGHEVDVVPPDDVEHVERYDGVVLGSAVYVGRLAASLRALVERCGAQLADLPVWLFWSGPLGAPAIPPTEPDDVGVIARRVGARSVQAFDGRLQGTGLTLSERALVSLIDAPRGDFRDFDAVREWAAVVADDLARLVAASD